MTRSGFVAVAGRPNVGKSTLVNALTGSKVAIVSDKPQTTRREIRGIATGPDWQLVLADLPGVQRPRDPLTERMQARVERALGEADAVLLLLNGEQRIGPGDRFIARAARNVGLPAVIAVNKVDKLSPARTLEALSAAADLGVDGEIFPISALTGAGVAELAEHLVSLLPEGPLLYPPEEKSDLPERVRLAELIREQVLRRTREELPHAVEVEIDELEERDDGLLVVRARVWAETESQKGILVGAGGRAHRLDHAAARAHQDALLRLRLRPYAGAYHEKAVVALLELVDLDLHGVRQLLPCPSQHLLADELGEPHALREVALLVGWIEQRPFRQERDEMLHELRDAIAGERADRKNLTVDAEAGRGAERLERARAKGLAPGRGTARPARHRVNRRARPGQGVSAGDG